MFSHPSGWVNADVRRHTMSFFELFRILHATHFILGAYWALLLLRFVPAALGAVTQPAMLAADAVSAIACSVLSLLWYFVWFGSIQFGLHGRFPLLSVRSFSILLGVVYSGFGIFAYLNSKQSIGDFSFRNQEYLMGISVMLLLSALGIVFLPKLKMQADKEDEQLTHERDQRLDQLYPWIDSRSGASNQISTNNPMDRSGGPTAS
jgi:hypothetical protein